MLIQEMSREECFAHLGQRRLARLACAHEGQPYIVPIYCVHDRPTADEDYLYSFSTPGQKIEWMRANPLVCVEFDEVANSEQWVSIVIGGSYEELPPPPDEEPVLRGAIRSQPERAPERLHAWRLLQAHPMWWQPASAAHAPDPMLRTFAPIFYRIRIDRITGRRATGAESRPPEPPQGWLRRLMRRFFSGGKSVRRQKSRDGPGVR